MSAAKTAVLVSALAAIFASPSHARGRGGADAGAVGAPSGGPVAAARRDPSAAWTSGTAGPADCTRGRRKLWQAGEGWIVKTITTCR